MAGPCAQILCIWGADCTRRRQSQVEVQRRRQVRKFSSQNVKRETYASIRHTPETHAFQEQRVALQSQAVSPYAADTFILTGASVLDCSSMLWMHAPVRGEKPSAREDAAWAYDAKTAKLVLLGGWAEGWLDDLYTLDVEFRHRFSANSFGSPMPCGTSGVLQVTGRWRLIACAMLHRWLASLDRHTRCTASSRRRVQSPGELMS